MMQHRHERGISLLAVLFFLIVFGALALVITQITATQHLGSAYAQQGKQAWYAARAGLEWGRYYVLDNKDCSTASNTSLQFAGFAVVVSCEITADNVREDNRSYRLFKLESTATLEGGDAISDIQRIARMSVWVDVTPAAPIP
ncbi:type IV pilus modification PilV family protein [Thiorhodospira sibirica]|uniref:type IV pilus modification PilV family protein n=1 Tax=Thiorhodospira sibirica TaxID=154347 RepID=UPI00022C11CC|nr:hypothetical protein [Thiorhodospira sibirica]